MNISNELFFALYVYLTTIQIYGATIFIWWWAKSDWRASSMYLYVTVLFAAMAFRNVFDTLAFWDRNLDGDPVVWVHNTVWWKIRILVVAFVCTALLAHMTYRIISGKDFNYRGIFKKIMGWLGFKKNEKTMP